MKKSCVYKITSPSGRVYIGSTNNSKRRFKEYSRGISSSQRKLKASFDKYGFDSHNIVIIWEGEEKERFKKEAEFGKLYDVLDKKKGLNLKLPKIDDNIPSFSQETLDRMKLARKGKSANWNNESVSLYNLQGKYIKTFSSFLECAAELNTSRELICSVASGRVKTFKNILPILVGLNLLSSLGNPLNIVCTNGFQLLSHTPPVVSFK